VVKSKNLIRKRDLEKKSEFNGGYQLLYSTTFVSMKIFERVKDNNIIQILNNSQFVQQKKKIWEGGKQSSFYKSLYKLGYSI
jgi:hypothetical protein